ncbi:hypothetical protein HPP92_021209 [Vanilla planifolia]|uniref:Uncharacterized protein n=1 Tax=Vanilla planifolia TaxID=51239 RepID=A0A835Q144_VANPL|nr:hypothetical protein HPP92_021209 [Vanilla planifolia]
MASRTSWVSVIEKAKSRDPSTELDLWRKHSIYRVPACIKDLNPKAYKPQVVSFGPHHHGAAELAGMEEHKHRALIHLLRRSKKPLDDFATGVEEIAESLQGSYQGLADRWTNDVEAFLRVMILDGCFMLEILRLNVGLLRDYAPDDPIFSNHGMLHMVPYIKRDMLIVENQLPLLVLERLLSVETGKPANPDQINRLVLKLCSTEAPAPSPGIGLALHPLDLYRRSLLQGPSGHPSTDLNSRRRSSESGPGGIVRSAIELYEAGVRFRISKSSSLQDIRFQHGVLSLPPVVVDDATEYAYLNLMAFERLHVGAGSEITSYVFFMDNIIDSAKDVALLHSKASSRTRSAATRPWPTSSIRSPRT